MEIGRSSLSKAVEAKIITKEQSEQLIEFFKNRPEQGSSFNLTNVLYYFGGLLAIGAMSLFMNLAWEHFGGWGILFLCFCYGILSLALTYKLDKKGLTTPAGISATFAICLTPLAIYGLQQGMGWWPDATTFQQYNYFIKWHWVFMELGTLAAGLILIWFYRYPFMVMPIAVTLWYLSMDATSIIHDGEFTFEVAALVSMYFGLFILAIAFWVDLRSNQLGDYAFWLYLFGVLAFWGGLTTQHSHDELSKLFYLCINLALILVGVTLSRKVFVVFGALGTCFYLGHLAYDVFKDSALFPVVLTTIGAGIIYLGIIWQKYEAPVRTGLRLVLPKPLRDLLDSRDQSL